MGIKVQIRSTKDLLSRKIIVAKHNYKNPINIKLGEKRRKNIKKLFG